jgi:hypothetical protein
VNRWINKLLQGVAGGFFGQAQVNTLIKNRAVYQTFTKGRRQHAEMAV